MNDYTDLQTASAIPEAGSMIETFRAYGYSPETAIADIIDNSLSAGASRVWVNFEWKGTESWITIRDNGSGMNDAELIQAMRPGSWPPFEERGKRDLGRFGLGLKTASFSQARRLTVVSRREGEERAFWTWDLDYVKSTGKWDLVRFLPQGIAVDKLDEYPSGTLVIWMELDRLVKNMDQRDDSALAKFLEVMEKVKKHLSMVFHRFIEKKQMQIYFQDTPLLPWDPFMTDEVATQVFPEEPLCSGQVRLKGYVLPHKSKLSDMKFRSGEGLNGWNAHQGFYIYRNERLLVAGDWLGMFRKEEHYKLARIRIDLPNSLDADWQIDIKKSVARPPLQFVEQIRAYARKVREQGVEVYRHRGRIVKNLAGNSLVPVWNEGRRGEKWYYKVNRTHPLLVELLKTIPDSEKKNLEKALRLIEETVPVRSIYIREAEQPEMEGRPFEGTDQGQIRKLMQKMYRNLRDNGTSPEQAKIWIVGIEPFNQFEFLIDTLS
ncbi:ATP-binding protein [Culturomica massiliensis]|uniref:ATP-binding protein n=1 Tax=Culturomica massiliensis TaxID=1841857 RepID=UPI003AEF6B52